MAEKSTRRKIIAEAKKEAKGKATSHQGSDAWAVFTLDYKHHAEIPVHKSSDFKGDGADYNAPFLIKDVDTTIFEDAACYSVFKVWCNGFGHDDACKKAGRATWNLDKAVLAPPLLSKCKSADKQVMTGVDPYDNLIYNTECYGNMPQCRTNGTEPQSVNSLRLQLAGKRQVIAFRLSSVMKFMASEKEPRDDKPGTVSIGNFMKFLEQQHLDAIRVSDALTNHKTIFHGGVEEKQMIYVPLGWWVVDRVICPTPVFGLRAGCLLLADSPGEKDALAAIIEMAMNSQMKSYHIQFFKALQIAADEVVGAEAQAEKTKKSETSESDGKKDAEQKSDDKSKASGSATTK